jgi:hypothetical protein
LSVTDVNAGSDKRRNGDSTAVVGVELPADVERRIDDTFVTDLLKEKKHGA